MSVATELVNALQTARSQLITLGGDPRLVNGNGDEIQHRVLEIIDAALTRAALSPAQTEEPR